MIARAALGASAVAGTAALCWIAARTGGDAVVQTAAAVPRAPAGVVLAGADGAVVRLARGPRVVVFGYTRCPDECPTALRVAGAAVTALRVETVRRVTFVDVDPWRDSRADVARYVAHFDAVEGVTGDVRALADVERALGMAPITRAEDVPRHDPRVYVLDAEGVVLGRVVADGSVATMQRRLRALLSGEAAPQPSTEASDR